MQHSASRCSTGGAQACYYLSRAARCCLGSKNGTAQQQSSCSALPLLQPQQRPQQLCAHTAPPIPPRIAPSSSGQAAGWGPGRIQTPPLAGALGCAGMLASPASNQVVKSSVNRPMRWCRSKRYDLLHIFRRCNDLPTGV